MSEKELTPLEAYELFLDDVEQCVQSGGIHYIDRKNKDIIEKELKEGEKNKKALEIVKVLFQGRCKLYERTEYIETCNEEGCHAEKIATTSYILEFHNYDLHYEFHLHKDEFNLLKEVLL